MKSIFSYFSESQRANTIQKDDGDSRREKKEVARAQSQ